MTISYFRGAYAFLSNFYIEPDGTFVEWEYQRAKCAEWNGRALFDKLFAAGTLTPKQAKAIGRKVVMRPDWDDVKVQIMLFYVTKKFKDHRGLADKLLATGDAKLVEGNTWGDTFWGVDGWGLNTLGEILMQVRGELHA